MEISYDKLYGKEVDLRLHKRIEADSFVHIDTYTKNVVDKAWKG